MKAFKLHLQENKDIIINVPDELEAKRDEVFALASIELQEQIADGNVEVIDRVWPCLYCGEKFKKQGELLRHLLSHEKLEKRLKEKLAHLYKRPEDILPAKTPSIPEPKPQPEPLSKQQTNYEGTAGYRVRQIRSSLGESQASFGKRFNASQSMVSLWERNIAKPPIEVLELQPTQSSVREAEHPQESLGNAKN